MACVFGDRMCDQNGKASGPTRVSQIKYLLSRGQRKSRSVVSRRSSRRRLCRGEVSSDRKFNVLQKN
jgi:hypothetical protein